MPIHTPVAPVEQDRSRQPVVDRLVKGAADGWRQGYKGLLTAFAVDEQDAVTVFLAEILDIGAAGFGVELAVQLTDRSIKVVSQEIGSYLGMPSAHRCERVLSAYLVS